MARMAQVHPTVTLTLTLTLTLTPTPTPTPTRCPTRLGHRGAARASDAHLAFWSTPGDGKVGVGQRFTPGGLVFYQPWGSLRLGLGLGLG